MMQVALDPFGLYPGRASAIAGLTAERGTDPFAIHTAYVDCGEGPVRFRVRFEGLVASAGTLIVRIHEHSGADGAPTTLAAIRQFALATIAAEGTVIEVPVVACPGAIYALFAEAHNAIDAGAAAVKIVVRGEGTGAFADQLATARRTIFAPPWSRPIAHLMSAGQATLADPVSQMCTIAQFQEPAYAEWLARMRLAFRFHRKEWEFVYILQSLACHGTLRTGARGLGFGVGIEPLSAVMAAMGCTIVATDLAMEDARAADWNATQQLGTGRDALRRPDICPDDLFDARVAFSAVDMTAIPDDLTGFDFTWSSCAYEHLGSIDAGLRFFEASIRCLKPGGIAVHTTELNLSSNAKTVPRGQTVLFRRRDFERLAARLTAQGHAVAPIKFDMGDCPIDAYVDVPPYSENIHLKMELGRYVTTSFGMIVRRGAA